MDLGSERGHTMILFLLFLAAGYFVLQRAWAFGGRYMETRYRAHLAQSAARVTDLAQHVNQG